MGESSSSSSSAGIGFTGALTIAFIVLKLTGVISGYRVPCAHSVGFMEDQQGGKET